MAAGRTATCTLHEAHHSAPQYRGAAAQAPLIKVNNGSARASSPRGPFPDQHPQWQDGEAGPRRRSREHRHKRRQEAPDIFPRRERTEAGARCEGGCGLQEPPIGRQLPGWGETGLRLQLDVSSAYPFGAWIVQALCRGIGPGGLGGVGAKRCSQRCLAPGRQAAAAPAPSFFIVVGRPRRGGLPGGAKEAIRTCRPNNCRSAFLLVQLHALLWAWHA